MSSQERPVLPLRGSEEKQSKVACLVNAVISHMAQATQTATSVIFRPQLSILAAAVGPEKLSHLWWTRIIGFGALNRAP